jgi:response regulator RpfG family c-di-GMP phosphodiesterase/pSer/pThr/pTyr-binding forkhead associated (FHA) protein
MPQLRFKNGHDKNKVILIPGNNLILGRDNAAGVHLKDSGCSREHSEIFKIGEMYFIRDLGSRNGTYVNDNVITEELLREGDRILIGNSTLVFESNATTGNEPAPLEFHNQDDLSTTMELKISNEGELEGLVDVEAVQQLQIIYKLGKLITTASPSQLLNEILNLVASVIPAENVYVFIKDKTGKLVPRARKEKDPRKPKQISRTIIKRAITENRAVLTSDAMSDARFNGHDSIIMNKIHSVMCVPLLSMKHVSGVLYLNSSEMEFSFKEEHMQLATAMAFQIGIAIETLMNTEKQNQFFTDVIKMLIKASEMRDPKSKGHSERVYGYSVSIAKQLSISESDMHSLKYASLLHDVGKISMPNIDNTDPELKTRDSIIHAEAILKDIKELEFIVPIVKGVPEKWDGSGGPQGIAGENIPLLSRVISVANRLDHLLTWGGLRGEGLSIKDALISLKDLSNIEFDRKVVDALIVCHREGRLYDETPLSL